MQTDSKSLIKNKLTKNTNKFTHINDIEITYLG